MGEEQEGQCRCTDLLSPRRGIAIHQLMTRLLGRCTCEAGERRVTELYMVHGGRSAERISA